MSQHPIPTIAIPTCFHSFETGLLFANCIECDKYLLDNHTDYFIEKAIKHYEGYSAKDVIFEYAICQSCAEKMRESMSKESLTSLESYFTEKIDIQKRMDLMNQEFHHHDPWINECMITGQPITELSEYQLFAQCRGGRLIMGQMPYMISGRALDEISDLLSKQTLDQMDDFSARHFGPPPGLEKDLPKKRFVLV